MFGRPKPTVGCSANGRRRRKEKKEEEEEGELERDLEELRVRRWTELVADRKKWKDRFDRSKPTVGCSANGRNSKLNPVPHCLVSPNNFNKFNKNSPN